MVLTVTVFASGIAAYVGPSWMEPAALMTHKVSFYLWLIALVGHTVPHFAEALHLGSIVIGASSVTAFRMLTDRCSFKARRDISSEITQLRLLSRLAGF